MRSTVSIDGDDLPCFMFEIVASVMPVMRDILYALIIPLGAHDWKCSIALPNGVNFGLFLIATP